MGFDKDNEHKEIIKSFVEEGLELLENIEPQLVQLENIVKEGALDTEIVDAMFRLFHSLKGSASYLNFKTVSNVTHEAENLLDLFRKEATKFEPHHIELLYRSIDFLKQLIDHIDKESNDIGFEEDADIIIKQLGGIINKSPKNKEEISENKASEELISRFIIESKEIFENLETQIIDFEKSNGNNKNIIDNINANFHNFKGNVSFLGYVSLENLSHLAENLIGKINPGNQLKNSQIANILLEITDFLKKQIFKIERNEYKENQCFLNIKNLIIDIADKLLGKKSKDRDFIGEILIDMGAVDVTSVLKAIKKQNIPLGEILVEDGVIDRGTLEKALKKQQELRQNKKKEEVDEDIDDIEDIEHKSKDTVITDASLSIKADLDKLGIRVGLDKLDNLINLVGELVIAEAMVMNNPDIVGLDLPNFEKASLQLSKITRELQDVTMYIRMIPLSGLFRKMMRLVRDLSKKSNKTVDLVIKGEETEVDKNIIEEIANPLVHLIRNAIDHGLLTEEEKIKLDKKDSGKLIIEAKHSHGEVWISVIDDGKGLDKEKILQKAIQKGLIKDANQELTEDEIYEFIFEPGFSTSSKITDVSGRGVGLDVVKKNILKLRGKIKIFSESGKGTTFILRIPLTLGIIEGMVVRVGTNKYILPINSVLESFQLSRETIIKTPGDIEIVKIRDDLFPLIRLHDFYNVEKENSNISQQIAIIIESNQKKVCICLDEIIGQQQIVIKGMPSYMGDIKAFSGCSILGGWLCMLNY